MSRPRLVKAMKGKPRIAVLGSHSALEVCFGAKNYGFENLVVVAKDRAQTYKKYFASKRESSGQSVYFGCVDEVVEVEKFSQVLNLEIIAKLNEKFTIFVPNRSFETYLNYDYQAIEKKFKVPIFGNRYLLSIEERDNKPNQYDLLDEAQIERPKVFKDPAKIDRLVLVKAMYQSDHGLERLFFFASGRGDFNEKIKELKKRKMLTGENLEKSIIEEYLPGVQVNFNFFYSPLTGTLELLGTDTRRQTNLEGIVKLPAAVQPEVIKIAGLQFEEAGHVAVTVLESFLEQAFELGEKFVKASKKFHKKGIIGPFALQSMIIPGKPRIKIVVFDVSPRIPGSPGIAATPYSKYLWGKPMSTGERIAYEIEQALTQDKIEEITT
ncbi:DUF1297 domain-containing protein [Candidatus Curtissbacteria bacterium]|nr:DUF1297 domain-containing protein [Candidatus Curtissbacteria bacterium]